MFYVLLIHVSQLVSNDFLSLFSVAVLIWDYAALVDEAVYWGHKLLVSLGSTLCHFRG